MKTLVYAPRVEAFVSTSSGVIDISKDIAAGSVNRVVNGVSYAQITLNNRNARYTNVLKRMDRIHIRFFVGKKQYPVFTGYLTTVPVYDVYPTTATIEAQCTIKQIMHTYWDMTSAKAISRFVVERQPLKKKQVVIDSSVGSVVDGTAGASAGTMVSGGNAAQKKLIDFAQARAGKYYYTNSSARNNPDQSGGTDCSGFIKFCYKSALNIDIGGRTDDIATRGQQVFAGTNINDLTAKQSQLALGDVICYDWAGHLARYEHSELVVANPGGGYRRLGHGGPERGPTFRPLVGGDYGTIRFTVRRFIKPDADNKTVAPLDEVEDDNEKPKDDETATSDWDAREEYFAQQAADGLNGIRLKGFLNEVCGWDFSNIFIETLPNKLAQTIKNFSIVEGVEDPDEAIQRIYRTIMGDTFANSSGESAAVADTNSFIGTEGEGNSLYTKLMFGIAKIVSQLKYAASPDDIRYLGKKGGSGMYGLITQYREEPAYKWPKEKQDAKMLSKIKSLSNNGKLTFEKTVAAYVNQPDEKNWDKHLFDDTSNITVREFIKKCRDASVVAPTAKKAAPSTTPSGSSSLITTIAENAKSLSTNGALQNFLKGLREAESSNNYTAHASTSSASGAYQYITSTWNNYGGYKYAYLAPPSVQDKRAAEDALNTYAKYKDWEKVAANHIYPAWASDKNKWNQKVPNNPITLRQYVDKVCKYMNGVTSTSGADEFNGVTGVAASSGITAETFDEAFEAYFRQVNFNNQHISEASTMLSGEKALMNDTSALNFVQTLCKGSMRAFQSDPFGNFTAFYPDYFGMWKETAPDTMHTIQDVELKDFKIRATDKIYTHVYTIDSAYAPDLYGMMSSTGNELLSKKMTQGVVTFENEKLISTILPMKEADVKAFLKRFGGRPYSENVPEITNKTFARIYAMNTFLMRWAGQYNTSVDFTFQPALWPGTRAKIANTGVAVYIESVSHSFSYSSGFTTSAVVSCPQRLGSNTVADDLPYGIG